ncbi:MAG: orotidine-5'-phosphate decarboxylase [Candidatus Liptonbacteria bacterium]|nr:orotidine-5'-phosphate decarboxylase [Candidatus Liptonbacteria bacterium]
MELLRAQNARGHFVCVGLDSEFAKIPECVRSGRTADVAIAAFNRAIVERTGDLVCAYKPNVAFYEAHGGAGIEVLRHTINDIRSLAPEVPVILDAKRGDIGNTNNGYVQMAFEYLGVDAITVHSYLGREALQPFLDRVDKGIFVLCRTSNPGASEFQNLPVNGGPLYRFVARRVASEWNKNGNCGVVVGATYPEELVKVRAIVGDMPILIPGIGAQGGDLEKTVAAGKDSFDQGMIINSSRGIIFASNGPDFAEAARRETQKLHDAITRCLSNGGEQCRQSS